DVEGRPGRRVGQFAPPLLSVAVCSLYRGVIDQRGARGLGAAQRVEHQARVVGHGVEITYGPGEVFGLKLREDGEHVVAAHAAGMAKVFAGAAEQVVELYADGELPLLPRRAAAGGEDERQRDGQVRGDVAEDDFFFAGLADQ